MNKMLIKFFATLSLLVLASCATTYPITVIDQTDELLVIRATEKTKYKALIAAKNKVKSMLGEYNESQEPDCAISDSGNVGSWWECVVYAKK